MGTDETVFDTIQRTNVFGDSFWRIDQSIRIFNDIFVWYKQMGSRFLIDEMSMEKYQSWLFTAVDFLKWLASQNSVRFFHFCERRIFND